METRVIRWGIMGTGRMARSFCNMLRRLPEARIVAVGSHTKEKAECFAKEWVETAGQDESNPVAAYGSYEELVADEKVELVYIATPIGCHFENVKLCLSAGKHVLCEKALTQTAAEAEELERMARERNLFLMEALWSKCQPVFRKLLEWKNQGKFGTIQAVEARFYTSATSNHRLFRDPAQGGVLYDMGIYPLTYACALLGYEPKELHAVAAIGEHGTDVMENIQLRYENGSFAACTGGLSPEKQTTLYIHGTKGRVLIEKERFHMAEEVTLIDWNNQPVETFACHPKTDGYEYEAKEAMACIRAGRLQSDLVPMKETIAVIRLMEQCRLSCNFR